MKFKAPPDGIGHGVSPETVAGSGSAPTSTQLPEKGAGHARPGAAVENGPCRGNVGTAGVPLATVGSGPICRKYSGGPGGSARVNAPCGSVVAATESGDPAASV